MKIRLSCYPGGKKRAVTFSYDDGNIEDIRLIETLNKYNLKATFHLNSSKYDKKDPHAVPAEMLTDLYAGHEISSHTYTHPDMRALNKNDLREEVIKDRLTLEKIFGCVVRGMSYPFGTYNKEILGVLKSFGIEYSRTTKATKKFEIPENFLEWHPTCHHNEAYELIDKFDIVNLDWFVRPVFYIWGHSYEFERQNNWDYLEKLCQKISGKDDVWYAANIEIKDYTDAVNSLKISADNTMVYNPTATDVFIELIEDGRKNGDIVKIPAGKQVNFK